MPFPNDELDVIVEIGLNGAWIDITQDVLVRDGISITRGMRDEAARPDPAKCTLSIKNADGKYSPRNPRSPYFGLIGRNTPIRVSVNHGSSYLDLPATDGRAYCPDSSGVSVTGDIDIRIDVSMDDWRANTDFAAKLNPTGNQRSWQFFQDDSGQVWFSVSSNGSSLTHYGSTDALPIPVKGRQTVRVTMDVNNGSSGHTVTFYTGPSIEGPWTQLGDPVVTAGTTSIYDSTADLEVGDITAVSDEDPVVPYKVHKFELRSGINGTVVASPDFTVQEPGTESFTDAQGNEWTVDGATISNRNVRFVGEVSSWPTQWDVSGTDVWVPVEADGILRRLGQGGSDELKSAFYRKLTLPGASGIPFAYWPCEDESSAGELASAFGGTALTFSGSPSLASFTGFPGSSPLPVINDSEWTGVVPTYEVTDRLHCGFLLAVPPEPEEEDEEGDDIFLDPFILTLVTTGSTYYIDIAYENFGDLAVNAYDTSLEPIYQSGPIDVNVHGKLLLIGLDLAQNGSNINFTLSVMEVGSTTGLAFNATMNNATFGRVKAIKVNDLGGLKDSSVGHIHLYNHGASIDLLRVALDGHIGEPAGRRLERLCEEENIPFRWVGDIGNTARMGAQKAGAVLGLLSEAAEADIGLLYEPRDAIGITYRTRESLYNQTPAVTLDYAAGHVAPPLDPTDDDQNIRNDVTVSRVDGSSARAVVTEGPLSVADYPDGVGRYKSSVSLNLASDGDLVGQANWRAHLGTVNEARYPSITVNLGSPSVAEDTELVDAIIALDVGDRLVMENQPVWLPPDPISQLVLGYSETIGPYEWIISYNCAPESPYQVGVYDSEAVDRYDTAGSVTVDTISESDTTIGVRTTSGPAWTTDPDDLPFDVEIGGEQVTVTSIGGAGSSSSTITETFESSNLTVPVSGTWARTSSTSHAGSWSLKSANIGSNGTSDATITVPNGVTSFQFWYRVSSESGFDYFRFLINNVQQFQESGDSGWKQSSVYSVSPGDTLTFRYAKDGSVDELNDAAYIDDLVFTGTASDVQEFTVVRAVNGVSKSHNDGTPVSLWRKSYYAL